MAKQAKCTNCRVRWTWDKEYKRAHLKCPNCGGHLDPTTHQIRFKHVQCRIFGNELRINDKAW